MNYIQRSPSFEIAIKRHSYNQSTFDTDNIITFTSLQGDYPDDVRIHGVTYPGLLSYSFTESVKNVDSPFSLTVDPREDNNGASILDVVLPRDLVYITEHGVLRYIGVVSDSRYSAEMAGDGISRSIMISGYGLGGLLSRMGFVLDQYLLPSGTFVEDANRLMNQTLSREIGEGGSLKSIITEVVTNYLGLHESISPRLTMGLLAILNSFFDYESGVEDITAQYDIAFNGYQVGVNTIWTILQDFFPPPIYELFGLMRDGKYTMVARECPFDRSVDGPEYNDKWGLLSSFSIDPVILLGHDIGLSDNDVYTSYIGLLPGTGINQQYSLISENADTYVKNDDEMWQKYGYKPLYVEFKYYNHSTTGESSAGMIRRYSNRLYNWYKNNDRMYSGTVRIMNYVDAEKKIFYPQIGSRLKYLGGEFYIELTTRSWTYGGAMETSLTVNRGYDYANNRKIPNIGNRVRLIEKNGNPKGR